MSFFEQQRKAKRNTGVLITLYCIALIAIICSVYAGIVLLLKQVYSDPWAIR